MSSRVPFEPGSTSALMAVGAAAVAVAAAWWWWGRPDGPTAVPRPVASASALPAVTSYPPSSAPPSPVPSASSVAAGPITVDVRGDVERPGPIELPPGSRVMDAVAAAGGATGRYGPVNLARVLTDGEQIRIGLDQPSPGVSASGVPESAGSPTTSAGASDSTGGSALIDVNTASVTELEDLDGVGPVLASAIVQWRIDNGPFTSIDDLLDVSGIGDATLDGMRHQITVG